jgi:hypothetical protein
MFLPVVRPVAAFLPGRARGIRFPASLELRRDNDIDYFLARIGGAGHLGAARLLR